MRDERFSYEFAEGAGSNGGTFAYIYDHAREPEGDEYHLGDADPEHVESLTALLNDLYEAGRLAFDYAVTIRELPVRDRTRGQSEFLRRFEATKGAGRGLWSGT